MSKKDPASGDFQPDKDRRQGSLYDKIWRENMHSALPGIIQKVLKINVVKSEDLPHKIQITTQKESDALRKITDDQGNTFILHLEVQVEDEGKMPYRMLEYRVMIEQVYQLPVRQYVIYMGEKPPTMSTELIGDGLYFRYTLISFQQLPYQLFLSSEKPEEKLLAVLADFGEEKPEKVIQQVLQQVKETSDGDFSQNRYLQQLRVIIQLRSLAITYDKAMESIAKFFKEEKDPFYQLGEKRGLEKGMEEGIEKGIERGFEKGIERGIEKGRLESLTRITQSLIRETEFDDAKIARLVNATAGFVARVRREIKKTGRG